MACTEIPILSVHGPEWLKLPKTSWKTWDVPEVDEMTFKEMERESKEKNVMYSATLVSVEGPEGNVVASPFEINEEAFSSLERLWRVTALCLRFLDKLKVLRERRTKGASKKVTALFITAPEISKAKLLWEQRIQERWFSAVIEAIKMKKQHILCDQLGLLCDDDGLLRCHGRFVNAELTEAARQPNVLPTKGYYTKLVIESIHRQIMHSVTHRH